MGETRYRLIFKGEVHSGQDPVDVKNRLAEVFKSGSGTIEQLFCGKPVVVKKEIDGATAEKYRLAFENNGAIAYVQEMPPQAAPAQAAPPAAAVPKKQPAPIPAQAPTPVPRPQPAQVLERRQAIPPPPPAEAGPVFPPAQAAKDAEPKHEVTCPKCGHRQVGADECRRCGVIISKFQAREKQQQEEREKISAVLEIVEENVSLIGHNFVFVAPNLPKDKITTALSSIAASGEDSEEPVLLIDSTATGNAKNGLLLTDRRLYGRDMGLKNQEIDLAEIHSVEFETGVLNKLIINEEDFVNLPAEVDMHGLADMLRKLSAALRGREAVPPDYAEAIERPDVVNKYISEIREMLDEGSWDTARENLQALLHKHPDDWEIQILLARACFKEGNKKADLKAAVEHMNRAIELGAPATLEVAEAVSKILASKNRAAEGVVWLERAYDSLKTRKQQEKLEKQIEEYRKEHKLGDVWQFFSADDNELFEIDGIEVVRDKLVAGELPAESRCRRNRIGKSKPIAESLAKQEGRIGLLYKPIGYHVKNTAMIFGGIIATLTVVALIVAVFFGAGDAFTDFFKETGVDWGAMSIWAKLAFVALLVLTAVLVFTLNFPGLLILYIIGGTIAAVLTQGAFSFQELGGFMMLAVLGIPLFAIASAIVLAIAALLGFVAGFVAGAPIGWIIGIVRLPTLPKLPKPAPA